AHLGELPAGAHVARAPFGIRLEAAGREHHGLAGHALCASLVLHHDAVDAVVIGDELSCARTVPDLDARLLRELRLSLDEPRPAAHRFEREAAPEFELAADLEGLPAPGGG